MKKLFKISAIALALSSTAIISGCSQNATRQANNHYGTTNNTAKDLANEASDMKNAQLYNISNDIYVDQTPITSVEFNKKQDLPAFFNKKASMNLQSETTLSDIIARLTSISKVPVRIQSNLLDGNEGKFGELVGNKGDGASSSSDSSSSSEETKTDPTRLMVQNVMYDGTLSGLINNITDKLNLSWRWNGKEIQIFKYETRIFKLNALAGIAKVNATLSTTASSSGDQQNASSGQTTTTNDTTAIWADVGAALQSGLSPNGKIAMVPSSGTITVTDTPAALNQIESQIKEYNSIYSKQVMLNIKVYKVEAKDSDNYGIDWSSAWKFASGNWGIGVSAAGNTVTDATGSAIKLSGKGGSLVEGSVIAQALSKAGKTSLVTQGTVISLNGQTVPLNISTEKAYVQSTSTTVSGDSGVSSTSITPGTVTAGFAMNFTPRVTDGNNVIMRYTVDLSTIDSIEEFSTNDSTVQLPQRSVRNFMQNVSVKSGETLILTGFQQVEGNVDKQGLFSPSTWFAGGKLDSAANKTTIVIVVTPYITN